MSNYGTQEPRRSQASAQALEIAMAASRAASDARFEVARLQRELKTARSALRAAERTEAATLREYEDTPYDDEVAS